MTKHRKSKDEYAYRNKLPFFVNAKRQAPAAWWNVTPSGEYETDYDTGQAYAVAFWRVCGGRPCCGLELGQILFAMHDPARPRSNRSDGLSGIEIGFIRTIGDLVDIATASAVLIAQGPRRLATGKAEVTHRKVRTAAKFTQILLEGKCNRDRVLAAESAKRAA